MHPKSRWLAVFLAVVCLSGLIACNANQGTIASPAATAALPVSITEVATLTSPPPFETPTWTSLPPTETATVTSPPPTETATLTATSTPTSEEEIALRLGLHTALATGDRKYIVIRADFPDVTRQVPEAKLSERMLNFLNGYYSKASYKQLNFAGSMTKRYMLPHPVSYYKISPRNLEVDRSKVLALVNDVLNAADEDIEFTPDLYVLIALGATNEDYGMVGYSAVPGMLGFKSDSPIVTKSGEVVNNAVVFCENAHLGTYVHDTLHMLGGVISDQRMTPCLYDHDLQAKYTGGEDWAKILVNMGFWDPLSSHMPYEKELPPRGCQPGRNCAWAGLTHPKFPW